MKTYLTEEEKQFIINKWGVNPDDMDLETAYKIRNYLMDLYDMKGLDENYEPTKLGDLLETIYYNLLTPEFADYIKQKEMKL